MSLIVMGGNSVISSKRFSFDIDFPSSPSIDVTALTLYDNSKVRGDGDMCFYNQTAIHGGAVKLTSPAPNARFDFDLEKMPEAVKKVVVTATIEIPGTTFGDAGEMTLRGPGFSMVIDVAGGREAALILCEVYRHNGSWKVRNISQGFNGGLAALATHFGVDIAPSTNTPPPAPASPSAGKPRSAPAVNLSKITLTKEEKSVSLKKNDSRFGKIRVNLNWNQRQKPSGLFGLKSSAIDLDLGAFVEDRHGNVTAVQALGNSFGDFSYFPYVRLLGDDRTGAVSDGEWLEINGDMWPEFHRVLIYAFIYEGVPNWRETDGVVRVMVPGQPEIEVRMNEFDSQNGMCAVAYLENRNDQIVVRREVTFHKGHRVMDDAYGWGMQWRRGSK